ncbi:type II toxin-antitoxin system PemK/MazF family toxin [Thiocapsa roseopersicina]
MADQLSTADKSRLTEKLGALSATDMQAVAQAIRVQLGL